MAEKSSDASNRAAGGQPADSQPAEDEHGKLTEDERLQNEIKNAMEDEPGGKVSDNKEMKDKPPDTKGSTKGKDQHELAAEVGHRPVNNNEVPDESTEKENDAAMVDTYVMVAASETDKIVKTVNNTKVIHSNDPNVASSPTTVECKEQKETETSSTTIKDTSDKKTLIVKQIGSDWVLIGNDKKFILQELKSAETVTVQEGYIIADKNVYEIKTGVNGNVILEKICTATVDDSNSSSHASEGDNESKDHVRPDSEFTIKDNNSNSESHRCEKHKCRDSEYGQKEDDSNSKKSKTTSAPTRPPLNKGANNQVSSSDKKSKKRSDPIPSTNSVLGIHPEESKSVRNEDRHQTINENLDAKMQIQTDRIQKENRDEKDTIMEEKALCEMFGNVTLGSPEQHSTATVDTNVPKQVTDKGLSRSTHTPSQPAQKSSDFSRSTGTLSKTTLNETNELLTTTTGVPSRNDEEVNENEQVRLKQCATDGRNDNPETEDSTITSQHDCEVPALPPKSPKNSCSTGNPESETPVPKPRNKDKKLGDTKNKETTTGKTSGAGGDRCPHSGDEQNTSKATNSGAKSKATSVTDKDTAVGDPSQIEWKGSPSQKPRRPVEITILYVHAGKECTLQIEQDCDLETYLKWQFVLHNPGIFDTQARKVQETLNIKVCIENGCLLLDVCDLKIKPDTDFLIDSVNSVFIKVFNRIFVNSFPTHGVSASEVVEILKKTDLGKKHELYVECIDKTVPSLVYVVCQHTMRKETESLIKESIRLVSGFCSKVLRLPLVFKEVLDKHESLNMLTKKTKNLMVEYEKQDENDVFLIMMKGNKCDVELAEKLVTEKYQQYGYGVIRFTDIRRSARFENISEIVEKYLVACNLKLRTQTEMEIIFYINEKAKKVGICAENQQLADKFINNIKHLFYLQKVHLTGKLSQVSEQDLRKVISEKWTDYSENVIASIDEKDKVAELCGVEEDVKKVEKILQLEMNPVQDKIPKFKIIPVDKGSTTTQNTAKGNENGDNIQDQDKMKEIKRTARIQSIYVFQYLVDKVKIEEIGNMFSVKITEVHNETRQGFLLAGVQDCITKAEDKLEELQKSIMSETVHLNYSFTDQNLKFGEVVHNIERDNDILIKELDTKEKLEGAAASVDKSQEADCECVEDTKWTFPGGHMVVLTNGSAQECWEDMLVDIQVSEDSLKASNAVTSHGEDKKCIVLHIPAWYNGERKEKDIMRDAVMKMMKETQTYESTHVCIPLEPKGKWLFSLFAKGILVPVVEHLADINILPVKVQLCTPDIKSYRTCCEIAENVMKMSEGCKAEDKTNVNKIRTTIMKGELNKQKADVIVNTTSANLKLSTGRVSSALSKTAGPELQDICNKNYPSGIKSGEIAVTPGFKLPCRYVFHGAIDSYTGSSSVKNMQTFVFDCLKKATALQQKTISFPAIGTGNLSYPKDMVAAAMFAAVYEFDMKYKRSSLEEVLFVIYQKDYDTIKEFEKVERENRQSGSQQAKCTNKNSRHRSKALLFREVRVSARLGCLKDSEADAVIYLWEKRKKFSAYYQNEGILKVAGADVLRKFESLRKLGTFSTPGGNLKVREIIHVTCEDSLDSIVKAFEDSISEIDKRHMKSTIVFFPLTHPFVRYGKKLAESLVTATSKMAPFLKHLKDISIVVQGQPNFQAIFQYFESCNQPSSAEQLHVTLQITGPSKKVEQSKQQLKEKLGAQILVQDPVMKAAGPFDLVAPGEQKIDDRDGASDEPSGLARQLSTTDDKWNRDSLKEDKELNRYVEIENIPKGTTVDKLKSLLFVQGFPAAPLQLVFTDGMVKAIAICQGEGDAVKLSQFTGIPVLKFKHLKIQSLGSFTQKLDAKLLKVALQKKEYKSLVDELLAIEVNLANDIIKTQTSIQLQCAEEIVASYGERLGVCTGKKTHSEFEHVGHRKTVSGVSVLIWDIVRTVKAKEIKEIKSRKGSVGMDSKTSCITITILDTSGDDMAHADVVKLFAESIKTNDIDEIEIDAKYAADAPKWCKDIQETLTSICSFCIFIPDDKKVVVCCETYDDILKVKHQFLVKQGKVKPTARGGRRRRVLDSEKYQTAEGNTACVNKASSVKVPVDCIVNAANATLQHGGGVAEVIDRVTATQRMAFISESPLPFPVGQKSADVHTDGYCAVCNNRLTDPTTLDCGHMFCRDCITQQCQHTNICPTCGKECEIIAESRRLMAESEFVGTVKMEKNTVSDVDAITSAGEVPGRLTAESEFVGNVKVESRTLASDDRSFPDGAHGQVMAESEFVGTIKLESKAVSNDDASSSDDDDDDDDEVSMDNFELILKCVDKDGGRSTKILRAEIGSEALKWRYIFQNQDKRKEFEQKLKTFAATFEYKGESPVTIKANKVMKPSKLSKNIKQLIQSETSGLHVEEAIADADEAERVIGIMSYSISALTSQSVLRFMQHPQGQTKVWFVGEGEDVSDVLNLFKQTQSYLSNITLSGATQIKRTK